MALSVNLNYCRVGLKSSMLSIFQLSVCESTCPDSYCLRSRKPLSVHEQLWDVKCHDSWHEAIKWPWCSPFHCCNKARSLLLWQWPAPILAELPANCPVTTQEPESCLRTPQTEWQQAVCQLPGSRPWSAVHFWAKSSAVAGLLVPANDYAAWQSWLPLAIPGWWAWPQ